jgi:hypothetical protein
LQSLQELERLAARHTGEFRRGPQASIAVHRGGAQIGSAILWILTAWVLPV